MITYMYITFAVCLIWVHVYIYIICIYMFPNPCSSWGTLFFKISSNSTHLQLPQLREGASSRFCSCGTWSSFSSTWDCNSVDGSELPNNHLGCINPDHQEYHSYTNTNSTVNRLKWHSETWGSIPSCSTRLPTYLIIFVHAMYVMNVIFIWHNSSFCPLTSIWT